MSHKASFLIVAVIFALVTGACSLTQLINAQPTPLFPTLTSAPSLPTAAPSVTQAPAASATPVQGVQPTQPQVQPTSAPVTGNASPTPPPTVVGVPVNTRVPLTSAPPTSVPPTSAPPANTTTTVNIVLIAMNDNGASGPAVGCGDSAVSIRVQVPRTQAVLRASLEKLLSLHSKDYGESGLYNALYQSNLTLDSLALNDGEAVIRLKGQLVSGGVCDDPRIIAQIEHTALQFSTVDRATIYVNGTLIQDLLSGQ